MLHLEIIGIEYSNYDDISQKYTSRLDHDFLHMGTDD